MQIELNELLVQFKLLVTNPIMHLLISCAMFDIITGISKGFICKKANSTKALMGIVKHTLVILLVIITYPYLMILKMGQYANLMVIFYIVSYSISILENLNAIGVPFPGFLVDRLEKIREASNKGEL